MKGRGRAARRMRRMIGSHTAGAGSASTGRLMTRHLYRIALLLLVVCLGAADPCAAQAASPPASPDSSPPPATRAEQLRRAREAKQASLSPPKRDRIEAAFDFVEDHAIFLLTREGLYPKLGSLTTGSGFAAGAGFRNRSLFQRYGTVDVWAAGSMKGYFGTRAEFTFPDLVDGRLFLQAYGDHRDYPQEDYFGLGPDSLRADHVNFAVRGNVFGGRAAYQPVREHVRIGAGLEHIDRRLGRGRDRALPSIETRFDESTAPGLISQPDFLRTSVFVEVDYRRPRYARNGGFYRVEYSRFNDRNLDAFGFERVEVDLRHAVSFLGERRVLWGRAWLSTSDALAGQTMPFYEMPTLGGNDSLRGFRDYRFRGPHAMLLQGEYRIELWSALDLAFFYDTGKVAMRRGDLDFSNLEDDYGVGFRFNTDNGIVLRIDTAFGSRDGTHLWIVFGGVF